MANISGWESNIEVNGTNESDEIYVGNYNNYVTVNAGDGDDTITNWNSNSILNGEGGSDFFKNIGENNSIFGGDGDDTLDDYWGTNTKLVDAGTGNDSISMGDNSTDTTIFGGAGTDYIEIRRGSTNIVVDGGADNDTITNYSNVTTIIAGDGNDSIYNSGNEVIINGGFGNDTLENSYVKNVTLNGGEGDDILNGSRYAEVFQYSSGGGNDTITNYSGEDTIRINSGQIDNTMFSGDDLVFNIGDGSLTLKHMKNHAITVTDSSGNTTTKMYGTGYTPREVIQKFVQSMANTSLDTSLKLDEAIKACSHFNSLQEVIDQMVSDCRRVNNAETFLKEYCGIISDNDDAGAIIGWDMGGMTIKTSDDLLPEVGEAVYPSETTFTKRGLKITVPDKATISAQEQLVVQGFYSWWADSALKLIEDSYGLNLDGDSITLSFFDDDTAFAWGLGGPGTVQVNMAYTSFDADDKNGGGLDGLFSHELTHVLQGEHNIWSYMPNYMTEGMADLTAGRSKYMNALAGNADSLAAYLDVNNTFSDDSDVYAVGFLFWRYLAKQSANYYDSLQSYSWKDSSIIDGTANSDFLTGNGDNITINGSEGNDTITVYGKNSEVNSGNGDDYILPGKNVEYLTINGGNGSDTIDNFAVNSFINGDDGNDSINSKADSVKIFAGDGNDTIRSYGKNSNITGGNGNDIIENEALNSTINGGSDADSINSKGDDTKIFAGDGNDTVTVDKTSTYDWDNSTWIYTIHNNATIDGGLGDDLIKNYNINASINGGADNDTIYNFDSITAINGDSGNDIIINGQYFEKGGFNVTLNGGAGNDTITSFGSNSILNGGAGADVIHNGYYYYEPWDAFYENNPDNYYEDNNYNGSNVTITGGAGDDSIYNRGANTFINYADGDGNDTIYNFNSTDTINITSGNYTTQISEQDIIIKIGDGSITLKDAKDKNVNINGEQKTIDTLIIDDTDSSPITVESSIKIIDVSSRSKATKVTGNDLANTIQGGKGKDTIYGGADNDSIIGNAGNDKLYGDAGADTLIGNKGNDTLTGGAGNDVFVYSSGDGKDVIADFTSGQDSIKIDSGNIKKVSLSGNDVILKVGTGQIKVKKAKGKALTIVNANGVSSVATFTDTLTLTNSSANSVKVTDSLIKTINASTRTKAIKIIANSNANTIYSGKGNDTLTGGSGRDIFIYSSGNGKDVITDYTAGQDKIKLSSGKITKTSISGNDLIFTVGSGNIRLKNAKNKAINIIDSSNKSTSLLFGSTSADNLNGTTAADSILGNAGNDTLTGSAGNDTLTGSAGADIFVYKIGDGNDTITDYTAQDKISITGGTYTRSTVGSDVKIKIGSGSILLKNAKNKKITINNSRNFEEPWFAVDDNFIGNAAQVDSIIKTDNIISNDYKFNDEDILKHFDTISTVTYTKD